MFINLANSPSTKKNTISKLARHLNLQVTKYYQLLSYVYSSLKISLLKYHFIKTKLGNLKEENPIFLSRILYLVLHF